MCVVGLRTKPVEPSCLTLLFCGDRAQTSGSENLPVVHEGGGGKTPCVLIRALALNTVGFFLYQLVAQHYQGASTATACEIWDLLVTPA